MSLTIHVYDTEDDTSGSSNTTASSSLKRKCCGPQWATFKVQSDAVADNITSSVMRHAGRWLSQPLTSCCSKPCDEGHLSPEQLPGRRRGHQHVLASRQHLAPAGDQGRGCGAAVDGAVQAVGVEQPGAVAAATRNDGGDLPAQGAILAWLVEPHAGAARVLSQERPASV